MNRALDILLVLLSLPITLLVCLTVGILVRFRLGSPVLFWQIRPGLNGKPFHLCKFRSMRDARDNSGNLLPDSERLTAFGRFLRASSLDELPELYNVLIGDMSIVGPRPLLMEYLPLYSPGQARRHEVRPGITGWAQINGRNALSWPERFEHDVWYVDNKSIPLDLLIIIKTIWRVIRKEGVTTPGHATAETFTGNPDDFVEYGPGKLWIIGAGGHGKVVADAAAHTGHWKEIKFLDDRFPEFQSCEIWPVVGKSAEITTRAEMGDQTIVAIGCAQTRVSILDQLRKESICLTSVIHPRAYVSSLAKIGPGSVICAGAKVGPGSNLGSGCIVNTNASIDHDCRLEDGVHVCPGANLAGNVSVGRGSWIGVGASVREGMNIENEVTVGAGAAVVNNLSVGERVGGVPARPLASKTQGEE